MRNAEPRLGIVYEHPQWFAPLFAELDRRGVPFDRIDLSRHRFDPMEAVPWTIALNRLSPSAFLRGHGQTIVYGREFLRFLEWRGADVVNNAAAFGLEASKASQLLLLEALGLRTPRARVINHPAQARDAAEQLKFPVIVKPNVGGSGAGIQRFDTLEQLTETAATGVVDMGIDGTALVQEFLPARGDHIVRVEVLAGRFLYAIKVYPNFAAGFNLCPADICQPEEMQAADLCPVDLPKVALKVEGYTPSEAVIRDVLAITRRAGIDLGGVEYLVNDRDGEIYFYDVNVLSNFVSDAPSVVGFDPYAVLVDYLVERGRLPQVGGRIAVRAGIS
ncbi:MAG TPA: hypothetical protein VFH67_01470 [bacterium]|nr:hypothetical protein [bacterium]